MRATVVAVWLVMVAFWTNPGAAQDPVDSAGVERGLLSDVLTERPNADAGPTKINVGLYVVDINRVDDVDQSFTADFVVRLSWHDPRLAADVEGVRVFKDDEIWHPRLTVLNKRRLWPSWNEGYVVDPEGNVRFRERYWGQLTSPLNLRDFPFDRNMLKILVVAPNYSLEDLDFTFMENITGRSPKFSLVDAAISEGIANISSYYFAPADAEMAMLSYEFEIRRYTAYYLWKVILPLAIIIFMSWLVFWIEPSQFGSALALSATSVLTLIAYRFLLGNLVPKVSYLTRLDIFIMGATILVFLGMVDAVTASKVASRNAGAAETILRVSRVLFPSAFAVLVYLAFFF